LLKSVCVHVLCSICFGLLTTSGMQCSALQHLAGKLATNSTSRTWSGLSVYTVCE
jgi:hypothetical protein